MPVKRETNTVKSLVYFNRGLRHRLKVCAAERRMTMRDAIDEAVRLWIAFGRENKPNETES